MKKFFLTIVLLLQGIPAFGVGDINNNNYIDELHEKINSELVKDPDKSLRCISNALKGQSPDSHSMSKDMSDIVKEIEQFEKSPLIYENSDITEIKEYIILQHAKSKKGNVSYKKYALYGTLAAATIAGIYYIDPINNLEPLVSNVGQGLNNLATYAMESANEYVNYIFNQPAANAATGSAFEIGQKFAKSTATSTYEAYKAIIGASPGPDIECLKAEVARKAIEKAAQEATKSTALALTGEAAKNATQDMLLKTQEELVGYNPEIFPLPNYIINAGFIITATYTLINNLSAF